MGGLEGGGIDFFIINVLFFQNNPADNLLKADGTHKWKCATAGEKSISAVLQVIITYCPASQV